MRSRPISFPLVSYQCQDHERFLIELERVYPWNEMLLNMKLSSPSVASVADTTKGYLSQVRNRPTLYFTITPASLVCNPSSLQ